MLIVKVKDGDKIEQALKQFKNKFRKTKMMEQLRDNKQFDKPSVKKRNQKLKAKYIQKLKDEEN